MIMLQHQRTDDRVPVRRMPEIIMALPDVIAGIFNKIDSVVGELHQVMTEIGPILFKVLEPLILASEMTETKLKVRKIMLHRIRLLIVSKNFMKDRMFSYNFYQQLF